MTTALNETVLSRIDAVLGRITGLTNDHALAHQVIAETTTIIEALYGSNSIQLRRLNESLERVGHEYRHFGQSIHATMQVLKGTLIAAQEDVAAGRLQNLIRDSRRGRGLGLCGPSRTRA
jgi:hypothetical protein